MGEMGVGMQMSRIFNKIPAFAPDYSGASSVLHDMGGMIVYCGVGGCCGNYAAFDEPRMGFAKRIFSLAFRETHIVMGIDNYAKRKIVESYRRVGGKFVALIGTPTSTIIGTDFKGLGKEIEKEIGVPVIYVETSGIYSYEAGQRKVYEALISYAKDKVISEPADVHIIGATPLDAWDYGQKDAFMELLGRCGAVHPVMWGDEHTFDDIGGFSYSKLNIAVSVSAVRAVRELKEKYGTPYKIGFPVGETALARWEREVRMLLRGNGKDAQSYSHPVVDASDGAVRLLSDARWDKKRVLIVGEQVASDMLRNMLREELGCKTVDVMTLFGAEKDLLTGEDYAASVESEFVDQLERREKYDIVIGDTFLTRAVPYEIQTVNLPSIAISGLVFMRQSPVLYGEKGTLYFRKIAEELKGGEDVCA